MLHAIIMAGGSGTRFWPASRADRPKQLLDLADGRTMIQSTAARLDGLTPAENTLIVTNKRLVEPIRKQLPDLPAASVLGEPCKRDTAPCIGVAAVCVAKHDPDIQILQDVIYSGDNALATYKSDIIDIKVLCGKARKTLILEFNSI